jgi:hypothetical protein
MMEEDEDTVLGLRGEVELLIHDPHMEIKRVALKVLKKNPHNLWKWLA